MMRIRIIPDKTMCYEELLDDPKMRQMAFDLLHTLDIDGNRILENAHAITRTILRGGDYHEALRKKYGLEVNKEKKPNPALTDLETKNLTSSFFNYPTHILGNIFSFIDDKELKTTIALSLTCKAFSPFFQGLTKIKNKILLHEMIQQIAQKLGSCIIDDNKALLKSTLEIISKANPELSKVLLDGVLERSVNVPHRISKTNPGLSKFFSVGIWRRTGGTKTCPIIKVPLMDLVIANDDKTILDIIEVNNAVIKYLERRQNQPRVKKIFDSAENGIVGIVRQKEPDASTLKELNELNELKKSMNTSLDAKESKAKTDERLSDDTYCGFKRGFLIGKRF